jgi:hypothetical protein
MGEKVMYVKIYKRRRDGSYTANVVKTIKKGGAVKVAKIHM